MALLAPHWGRTPRSSPAIAGLESGIGAVWDESHAAESEKKHEKRDTKDGRIPENQIECISIYSLYFMIL